MNKWILQLCLGVVVALAGLSLCPNSLAASLTGVAPALQVKPSPAPTVPAPSGQSTQRDFADSDFESADQPEFGTRSGGVIVILGGLIVLLAVVFLVVLLIWLIL